MTTTTYRAVQATPDGRFGLVDRPLEHPGPGQVRLRVEACGICHSDVLGVHNVLGNHPAGQPVVPGHEIVGRIEALGDGVAGWAVGQRVGVGYLGGACGVCDNCRRGDFVYCTDQPTVGDAQDGGYAEQITVRSSGLVAVPDGLDPVDAAPLMCAGPTVYKGLLSAVPKAGDLVAVQGIGGLGHLAIQYARHMGFEVAAVARGTGKRQLAEELGAHHYIDSSAGDPGAALQALGGAQVVLATAASGAAMSPLIDGLAVRGRLQVLGAATDPIEVQTGSLIMGGRSIQGSLTGTPRDNEDNLAYALANGIRPMVEPLPLADAGAGYERMLSGAARFRVVLTVS